MCDQNPNLPLQINFDLDQRSFTLFLYIFSCKQVPIYDYVFWYIFFLAKTEGKEIDLNIIPVTEPLNSDLNLDKKRVAEAQNKIHKPTRASWGCSLDDVDVSNQFIVICWVLIK